MQIHVTIVASMATVVSVAESTKPEMTQHASLLSKQKKEEEQVMVTEQVAKAVQGPKSFTLQHPSKHNRTDDVINPVPKFKRGFAWSNSSHNIHISFSLVH